jgi:hypothetical protein
VLPPYLPADKLRIGHFDSLSATRNLVLVIAPMEMLQMQLPASLADLELHFSGGPLDGESFDYLNKSPVRSQVRHFGSIEADPSTGTSGRDRILHLMRSMDVLLLLHATAATCAEYILSKMYEYLWMQTPILALMYRSSQMSNILSTEGHQVAVVEKPDDSVGMARLVLPLLASYSDAWLAGGLVDNRCASTHTAAQSAARLLQASTTS